MTCKVFTCVHNKVCKSYIGGVNCKVLTMVFCITFFKVYSLDSL